MVHAIRPRSIDPRPQKQPSTRIIGSKKKKRKRIPRDRGPVERHWRTRVPADSEAHLRNASETATTWRVLHAPVFAVRSAVARRRKRKCHWVKRARF